MYEVNHVTVTYQSGVTALSDISLRIAKGDWLLVTGRSGAGKSTLLSVLRGDVEPAHGEVVFEGVDLFRLSGDAIGDYRCRIGSSYQEPHFLGHLTVAENVALVMEHAGRSIAEIDSDVPYVLDLMGIGQFANRYPHELSGGEKQRLQLARSFVHQPEVLLIDEPLAHLDSANAEKVLTLLKTLHGMGTTLIVTAHNRAAYHSLPNHVIGLEYGAMTAAF